MALLPPLTRVCVWPMQTWESQAADKANASVRALLRFNPDGSGGTQLGNATLAQGVPHGLKVQVEADTDASGQVLTGTTTECAARVRRRRAWCELRGLWGSRGACGWGKAGCIYPCRYAAQVDTTRVLPLGSEGKVQVPTVTTKTPRVPDSGGPPR